MSVTGPSLHEYEMFMAGLSDDENRYYVALNEAIQMNEQDKVLRVTDSIVEANIANWNERFNQYAGYVHYWAQIVSPSDAPIPNVPYTPAYNSSPKRTVTLKEPGENTKSRTKRCTIL